MSSEKNHPSIPHNAFYSFAAWALPVVLYVLYTPYIVTHLGVDAYGVLLIVNNILGYFAFLNLNLSRATTKYLSEERAQHDNALFGQILSSGFFIHVLLGLIVGSLVWAFCGVLVSSWLAIPISLQPVARWVFCLGGGGFIFMLQSQVLRSVPEAFQRFDISKSVQLLLGTVSILGIVIIVRVGFGLREIAVWNLMVAIFGCCLWYAVTKRLAPNVQISARVDREVLRQIFNFGLLVTIGNLVSLGSTLVDRTWIAVSMGTGALTYYSIPASAARYIHGLVGSFLMPLFPLASRLGSIKNGDQLRSVYLRASKYASTLAMFLAITMSILSFRILSSWMGLEFAKRSASSLSALALAWSIWAISIVAFRITEGLGHPGVNLSLGLGITLVSIVGYFVLIPRLGILGAALAKLAGTLIVAPIYVVYVQRRFIRVGVRHLWASGLRTAILAGISAGLVELVLDRALPAGIIWLVICVGVGGIVWVCSLIILGFVGIPEQQWLRAQQIRLASLWSNRPFR